MRVELGQKGWQITPSAFTIAPSEFTLKTGARSSSIFYLPWSTDLANALPLIARSRTEGQAVRLMEAAFPFSGDHIFKGTLSGAGLANSKLFGNAKQKVFHWDYTVTSASGIKGVFSRFGTKIETGPSFYDLLNIPNKGNNFGSLGTFAGTFGLSVTNSFVGGATLLLTTATSSTNAVNDSIGGAALIRSGAGSLILNPNNGASGNLTINGGTLLLNGAGALIQNNPVIPLNGGTIGSITTNSSGAIFLGGGGVLTLSGSNIFSGATVINGGTLTLGSNAITTLSLTNFNTLNTNASILQIGTNIGTIGTLTSGGGLVITNGVLTIGSSTSNAIVNLGGAGGQLLATNGQIVFTGSNLTSVTPIVISSNLPAPFRAPISSAPLVSITSAGKPLVAADPLPGDTLFPNGASAQAVPEPGTVTVLALAAILLAARKLGHRC